MERRPHPQPFLRGHPRRHPGRDGPRQPDDRRGVDGRAQPVGVGHRSVGCGRTRRQASGGVVRRPRRGGCLGSVRRLVVHRGAEPFDERVEQDRHDHQQSHFNPVRPTTGSLATTNDLLRPCRAGRRYRGSMYLLDSQTSRLTSPYDTIDATLLVNSLLLEPYLKGVVPVEIPSSAPLEALKAQAVAARSFAAHPSRDRPGAAKLVDSVLDQAYRGFDFETAVTSRPSTPLRARFVASPPTVRWRSPSTPPAPVATRRGVPTQPRSTWKMTPLRARVERPTSSLARRRLTGRASCGRRAARQAHHGCSSMPGTAGGRRCPSGWSSPHTA